MRLTDCFIDLAAYIAYFLKTVNARQPSFELVKADINRLIAKSLELSESGPFSQEDYHMARFAVLAWIDEAISGSPWRETHRWRDETLQHDYYRTTDAGNQFFERLDLVGPRQQDVREVYCLCLAMGFTGRHGHDEEGGRILDQLKESNLKLLSSGSSGISSIEDDTLFPEAYPAEADDVETPGRERIFSVFTILCIVFPILFFAILFLIFSVLSDNLGESILRQVI